MKPFDLEAAKRGEKVITRDGREAEIAYFDMAGSYPLEGRVKQGSEWVSRMWTLEGRYSTYAIGHSADLFMAPAKRKVWVCYFGENFAVDRVGEVFTSREQAERCCKVSHSIHEVEIEL